MIKQEASKDYSIHSKEPEHVLVKSEYGEKTVVLPKSWIGVDLDGTLAYWDTASSIEKIGEPIPKMKSLVLKLIDDGMRVKIFTARAQDPEQIPLIQSWLKANGLPELEITNIKDYYMQRLYDDRSIQVEQNTGRLIEDNNA